MTAKTNPKKRKNHEICYAILTLTPDFPWGPPINLLAVTFIKADGFVIYLVPLQNAMESEEGWWGPHNLDAARIDGGSLNSLWRLAWY